MRILVVGQAPARNQGKDPRPWSDAASSRRLWKWFGCKDESEFLSKCEGYYACPWLEGMSKKGDKVPTSRGIIKLLRHRLYQHILTKHSDLQLIFLVGKFAQKVGGCTTSNNRLYETFPMKKLFMRFVCIPHPSGVNKTINGLDKKIGRYVQRIIREEKKKEIDFMSKYFLHDKAEHQNDNMYNECGVESCAVCPDRLSCTTYNREE